jgi:hypothetical protein
MANPGRIMLTLVPEVRLIPRPDAARTTNHHGGFALRDLRSTPATPFTHYGVLILVLVRPSTYK